MQCLNAHTVNDWRERSGANDRLLGDKGFAVERVLAISGTHGVAEGVGEGVSRRRTDGHGPVVGPYRAKQRAQAGAAA